MGLNHSPHPPQQRHHTTFSGTRIGNSKSWLKPQRSTAPRRDYRDRQCVLPISSPAHTPLPAAEVDKRAYRRLLHREGTPRQVLGYFYFEEEPQSALGKPSQLTRDETRRVAANFAKLPGWYGRR